MAATQPAKARTMETEDGTGRTAAERKARAATPPSRARRRAPASDSPSKPLPARQQRFVDEYLVDLNATRAATAAGYRATSARFQGSRLLATRRVADALQIAMAARAARTGITADRVLAEVEALAFSRITDYGVTDSGALRVEHGASDGAMRAVASFRSKVIPTRDGRIIDTELRLWDKLTALQLAGRHVNVPGFRKRVGVTGDHGKEMHPDPTTLTDDELEKELETSLARVKARNAANKAR